MDRHKESHQYHSFAQQYARLGFSDTYYLGFRDVPKLIDQFQITIGEAIDHGSDAGRATRFLKELGFTVLGVDRNEEMLAQARQSDPSGDYRLVSATSLDGIFDQSVDFIFPGSVLEEYSSMDAMTETFREFHRALRPGGKVMIVTASEDLPKGRWASFVYPDVANALHSGSQVRCTLRDSEITFRDYYWIDMDLRQVFANGGFSVLSCHRPLANSDEPFRWHDETKLSPWSVYVLRKKST